MQNNRTPMIDRLSSELQKSVVTVVSAQLKEVKAEVNSFVKAIEHSQQFISAKFDEFLNDFLKLKTENDHLKSEVEGLRHELSALKISVNKLEFNDDRANKDSLSKNAILLGVPVQENEQVSSIVAKVADCIGLDLPGDAIESASRLHGQGTTSNKHVPIRIVFKYKSMKESFFSKKKIFGKLSSAVIDQSMTVNGMPTNIVIRDELTPLSLELLREIRMLQKKINLKLVWTGREGAILVKKDENTNTISIKNRNDLENFAKRSVFHLSSNSTLSTNSLC